MRYASPDVYVETKGSQTTSLALKTRSLAGFVGIAQRGPLNTPVLLRDWDAFLENFGEPIPQANMPAAVRGFFENSGRECVVVRVGHEQDEEDINTIALAQLNILDQSSQSVFQCIAKEPGKWGNDIRLSIIPLTGQENRFHCLVNYGRNQEQYLSLSADPASDDYILNKINEKSHWITVRPLSTDNKKDKPLQALENQCLENGRDGLASIQAADFIGDQRPGQKPTGLQSLNAFEELSLLVIPDAVNTLLFFQEDYLKSVRQIQQQMVQWCEKDSLRFCLLDAPGQLNSQNISNWKKKLCSSQAALYFPWLCVLDTHSSKVRLCPPSGHVAGVMARLDHETKMLKHPANELVRGAIGVSQHCDDATLGFLNPQNINCVRAVHGRGIRIWGARTLSVDPEWRYINNRRLVSCIEKILAEGLCWVTFENNQPALWKTVIRSINGFLWKMWQQGYLSGMTPKQAYYVKCDEETNPTEQRNKGIMVVEIGLALAKPAEFIVVRVEQQVPEEKN
jgi:Bacteriophage tail sheath protein